IQCEFLTFQYLFFFQVEDGIRDFHVTGVQTCALPISGDAVCLLLLAADDDGLLELSTVGAGRGGALAGRRHAAAVAGVGIAPGRSEERRVGKEGRSRWSRYHRQKNRRTAMENLHSPWT